MTREYVSERGWAAVHPDLVGLATEEVDVKPTVKQDSEMADVYQLRKYRRKRVPLFGIELEWESVYNPINIDRWSHEHDGSLRNDPREYKTVRPNTIQEAINAVNNFYEVRDDEWESNSRTGCHIHVDISRMTQLQFVQFLLYLLVLDEYLFVEFDSEYRMGSTFCRMSSENSDFYQTIMYALLYPKERFRACFLPNGLDFKYHSINLTNITTLGTVELRHFTTFEDSALLKRLLTELDTIVTLCLASPISRDNSMYDIYNIDNSLHTQFLELYPKLKARMEKILFKTARAC